MRWSHNACRETHWTRHRKWGILVVNGAAMPWKNSPLDVTAKKPVQSEGIHSVALEPHYSVPQVAELWHISEKIVRRLFEDEEGVLRWGNAETARKRAYQNLRIPQSVLMRVHQRRGSA
jgi:hypothetical protein